MSEQAPAIQDEHLAEEMAYVEKPLNDIAAEIRANAEVAHTVISGVNRYVDLVELESGEHAPDSYGYVLHRLAAATTTEIAGYLEREASKGSQNIHDSKVAEEELRNKVNGLASELGMEPSELSKEQYEAIASRIK